MEAAGMSYIFATAFPSSEMISLFISLGRSGNEMSVIC